MRKSVPVALVLVVVLAVCAVCLSDDGMCDVTASWDEGIGSVEGTGEYAPGTMVTLRAELSEGYLFDGWYGPDGEYLCETPLFCLDAADIHVTVRTVRDTAVRISVEPDYGIASVSGDHRYDPGTEAVLMAEVKPGFEFSGWFSEDGKLLSDDTEYTLDAADMTIYARTVSSEPAEIRLTYDSGIESAEGAGTYTLGDEVIIEAFLKDGYLFDGWYDGDRLVSMETKVTVNADDQTLRARTFIPGDINVKLRADHGIEYVIGAGTYETNEVFTITAVLKEGYSFDGWYTTGGIRYSVDATTQVRAGDTDLVLYASTVHGFTYFPVAMAGMTAYGQKDYSDSTYAFVCASGVDPDRFRGWFDLDGRLVSRDIQYIPESCDTVLIAKTYDRFQAGDNRILISDFPDWYDEHSYCFVTEYHTNSYVTSFKGTDMAYVSVIPGEYEITFYNGMHDNSMKYSKVRQTVEGEMKHVFAWNYEGEHYSTEWTFDPETYQAYMDRDVNRFPGHDDIQRFFEYDSEPISYFAGVLTGMSAGMTETERAGFVLEFVHCVISYQLDSQFIGEKEWWKYPYETISDHRGDCEDSAILYGSLLKAMGYDIVFMMVYNDVDVHAAIGVNLEDMEGDFSVYDGKKYYYCETTGVYWKVGERPSEFDREIILEVQ